MGGRKAVINGREISRIGSLHIGTRIAVGSWLCELALWLKGWQTRGEFLAISDFCMLCIDSNSLYKLFTKLPSVYIDVVMYVNWVLQEIIVADPQSLHDMWRPDES